MSKRKARERRSSNEDIEERAISAFDFLCRSPIQMVQLASVGLRVSVSHNLGQIACEIAYEIACNLIMLFTNMLFINIRYTY